MLGDGVYVCDVVNEYTPICLVPNDPDRLLAEIFPETIKFPRTVDEFKSSNIILYVFSNY